MAETEYKVSRKAALYTMTGTTFAAASALCFGSTFRNFTNNPPEGLSKSDFEDRFGISVYGESIPFEYRGGSFNAYINPPAFINSLEAIDDYFGYTPGMWRSDQEIPLQVALHRNPEYHKKYVPSEKAIPSSYPTLELSTEYLRSYLNGIITEDNELIDGNDKTLINKLIHTWERREMTIFSKLDLMQYGASPTAALISGSLFIRDKIADLSGVEPNQLSGSGKMLAVAGGASLAATTVYAQNRGVNSSEMFAQLHEDRISKLPQFQYYKGSYLHFGTA